MLLTTQGVVKDIYENSFEKEGKTIKYSKWTIEYEDRNGNTQTRNLSGRNVDSEKRSRIIGASGDINIELTFNEKGQIDKYKVVDFNGYLA